MRGEGTVGLEQAILIYMLKAFLTVFWAIAEELRSIQKLL
jgi:hypothetical protein